MKKRILAILITGFMVILPAGGVSAEESDYTEEIEYLLSNMKIGTGAITTE